MLRRYRVLLPIAVALLATACHRSSLPDGVMDKEKMAEFMADMFMLEAYNNFTHPLDHDTLNLQVAKAFDDLLANHGISREEAEASIDYYSNNPEEYEKVLQIVLNNKLEDKISEDKPMNINGSPAIHRK